MVGFDLQWLNGTLMLPVWAIGAAAAAFLFLLVLAVSRPNLGRRAVLLGRNAVVLVALLLAWSLLDRLILQQQRAASGPRAEQATVPAVRPALEARARELAARTLVPGSALPCLSGIAGESVEAACEKALFASAEAAAMAVAYTAERLALLADDLDYARRGDANFVAAIEPWRRVLEADRYGFVAQVLASRYGCTIDKCDELAWLRDAAAVKNNLRARAYEGLVAQYSDGWKARPSEPGPAAAAAEAPVRTGPLPVVRNIDFPSAASIPAISIMNPEPTDGPGPTTGSAGTGSGSAPKRAPSAEAPSGAPAKRPAPSASHPQPNPWSTPAAGPPARVEPAPDAAR